MSGLRRERGLFVRINLAERQLIHQAAAAESMRSGEYIRSLVRKDATRLLGEAGVRAVLAGKTTMPNR
jgi:hypothetical protein